MSEASKEKTPEAKQQASQGSLIYHPHGGLATYPSVLGLESTAAAFVALQQRGHELLANSPVANESVHAVQRFFAVESLPRIVSDSSKKQAIASSKLISTPLDDARVAYLHFGHDTQSTECAAAVSRLADEWRMWCSTNGLEFDRVFAGGRRAFSHIYDRDCACAQFIHHVTNEYVPLIYSAMTMSDRRGGVTLGPARTE